MPSFATVCHIHEIGLQIHLQALGTLKLAGIPYSLTLFHLAILIELP
jgi:hypothetical protein